MTHLEWQRLEETLAHMTPDEKARLLALVTSSLSRETMETTDPLFGLMADEPELMDEVAQSAQSTRDNDPFRLSSDG